MCEALTGFDTCWAVLRNKFSKLDYYRRTHTTGEQARPYGSARCGYDENIFIGIGNDISHIQNQKFLMNPNVGACPARPQGICEYNCILQKTLSNKNKSFIQNIFQGKGTGRSDSPSFLSPETPILSILTGFDSCWAVSRNKFSKMDYYRRTYTTGEQARPYGSVRNHSFSTKTHVSSRLAPTGAQGEAHV